MNLDAARNTRAAAAIVRGGVTSDLMQINETARRDESAAVRAPR
jgi:hypothetical protein